MSIDFRSISVDGQQPASIPTRDDIDELGRVVGRQRDNLSAYEKLPGLTGVPIDPLLLSQKRKALSAAIAELNTAVDAYNNAQT